MEFLKGRFPDGTPNIISFPGSASPGTTNFVVSFAGPGINELMARNEFRCGKSVGTIRGLARALQSWRCSFRFNRYEPESGQIEPRPMDVPGRNHNPCRRLPHNLVRLFTRRYDQSSGQSELPAIHSMEQRRRLLLQQCGTGCGLCRIWFPNQQSIHRTFRRKLASAVQTRTPSAANSAPVTLASVSASGFNEWMAAPSGGDDWFETL